MSEEEILKDQDLTYTEKGELLQLFGMSEELEDLLVPTEDPPAPPSCEPFPVPSEDAALPPSLRPNPVPVKDAAAPS